jgi:hypothetical protein
MYISFTNELILIPITDYKHNKVENRFEKINVLLVSEFYCTIVFDLFTREGYTNIIYYIYFPNESSTLR